jgi:hypothetical protein
MPMVRALRRRYPGMRVMGIRHEPGDRRMVFDRAARETTNTCTSGAAPVQAA